MSFHWIYIDDFIELWIKVRQRGVRFIVSKLNLSGKKRTISSFSNHFEHANWWIIPYLNDRKNFLISGDPKIDYEQFITDKYFKNTELSTLVSLGCGSGSHEVKLAKLNKHLNVVGYDLSKDWIWRANQYAAEQQVTRAKFICSDVYELRFQPESVDYFLFNSSLHHFVNIDSLITHTIKPALKKGGLIIINEYVGPNRMNFPKHQIDYCNACLKELISVENRKILLTNMVKNRCYRLGKLRMMISDPSECAESEDILPVLRTHFKEIAFKSLGGNILMPILKHIAHNFVDNTGELPVLVKKEEDYLENHQPDYIFAVYQKE